MIMDLWKKLKFYGELVKFEHTIFALPFALSSIVILMKSLPTAEQVFWILLALISARTAGMCFNRWLDRAFDEKNPRTSTWPHVTGLVKDWEIKGLIFLSIVVFILSSLFLNKLALFLSPIVIILLFLYPLAKRFTFYPHLILGMIYFLIPIAVGIALNADISKEALLLGIAMAFWVAGFDVLYSLQDYEFDLKMGLKSIPVRFGIKRALQIARIFHFVTFLSLLILGIVYSYAGWFYFLGLSLLTLFLIYEHRLISEKDLSKINKAFFTVNGYISIIYFFVVLLDRLVF
ncbi:MAG: UbiA-like polyprenyltransferase [Caldimicrobium sp.]